MFNAALLVAILALAEPSWTLSGRVTTPDGTPVPGATVIVALRPHSGEGVESLATTACDAAGVYAIDVAFLRDERGDDLLSSVVEARAAAPRHDGRGDGARKRFEPPRPGEAADWRADLTLERANTVSGRVLLADGSAAADAIVEILSRFEAPGEPHWHSTADAVTSTAPDGSFVLPVPRAGAYHLRAQKGGAGLALRSQVRLESSGAETIPALTLECGPAIEGVVVAPDGTPIAGVYVRAKRLRTGLGRFVRDLVSPVVASSRHDVPQWFHAPDLGFGEDARTPGGLASCGARSGPDGRFSIRGLAPGEYEMKTGGDDPKVHAASGARDARVTLMGTWVRVRVRDDSGRPMPGVELEVGPSRMGDMTESYVTSAPSGIAMVPTRHDFPQSVTAAPRDFETARARWRVDGSSAITDVELVLAPLSPDGPRGAVRLRVTDETGAPVPRARGLARNRSRSFDAPIPFECDDSGAVLLARLHEGIHWIHGEPPRAPWSYGTGAMASAHVKAGAAVDATIVMPVGGRVRLGIDAPLEAGATIEAAPATSPDSRWAMSAYFDESVDAAADATGGWRPIAELPPGLDAVLDPVLDAGEWRLTLRTPDGREASATVTVQPGRAVPVTLDVPR